MNIVLLSGGSGKRLWPLSNETRSKQFLKLIKNDDSQTESMVQRVYRQIRSAGIDAQIVVATGISQVDSIQSQLGHHVDIVQEPERRDTFPAIALASSYLALEKQMSPDEVVVVLPVDPFAELHYFQTLQKMEAVVQADLANIALMGIRPTYPSAKYGYIVPDGIGHIDAVEYRRVDRFQEKPTEELAVQLLEQGAHWNGGVFAFKLGYLMEKVRQHLEFETYTDVYRQYSQLTKISFDYAVVEKESSIAMVEYDGVWKDLGTWNTLTEVMEDASIGKVIMSDTCENTHVINELDIPIAVLGAKNLVVAASPDGILVSDKHQSSYLKPLVDSISQRPMFEERRWGEYKVLGYDTFGDDTFSLTKHMLIKSGKEISYQSHTIRDEIWTIVDGTGYLVIDGHVRNVRRGDVAYITKGTKHAIKAMSDLHFIEVQIGSDLSEADIERFEWNW